MRGLVAIGLALGLFMLAPRAGAAAEDVKRFEQQELAIAFAYPGSWKLAADQPRGVLPDQRFSVRAMAEPSTAFLLAVYRIEAPVTRENLDATLERQDRQVADWIAGLPAGHLLSSGDVTVDDALGREYIYEYELDGRPIHAETLLVPSGDTTFEISQWAKQPDYENKLATFEAIFATLKLPWSPG